eukprot:6174261-Pleurochrysis_carterae.AAC.3
MPRCFQEHLSGSGSMVLTARHELNKSQPVLNRTVEARTERRNYQMHMERLKSIKPMIDNQPAKSK